MADGRRALLSFGHRAWHNAWLRIPHSGGDGVGLCRLRDGAGSPDSWHWLGLGRLLAVDRRRGAGDSERRLGTRERALYVLSAPHRKPVLLPRRDAGGGRLLVLDRRHDPELLAVEARAPGRACAARYVRRNGDGTAVALDVPRRCTGDPVPDTAGLLRLEDAG